MLTGLLTSFITTCLWIIASIIFMYYRPTAHRFLIMLKSFGCSLPFLGFFLFILQHQPALVEKLNGHETPCLAYLIVLIFHVLFFFFVVECFYHIERSVTLRILVEIQHSSSPMTVPNLMKDYAVDDMIKRRLEDMLSNNWIYYENNQWKLTSKGLWLARMMYVSCWLFQSKPQNERL